MEDNKILADNTKTIDTGRIITSLDAAKALRFILPYCRQITALRKYLHSYMAGNYRCSTPGYAQMIDKMAQQFKVDTSVWLMGRVDSENRKRYGKPLSMDEFPEYLLIDPGENQSLQEVCTRITAEKDYLLGLKTRALYIADQKGELHYIKVGYDSAGDHYYQHVTWEKRDFIVPASKSAIIRCREEGSPELPAYMTTKRPSISPYARTSTLQNACIIEKYIIQNKMFLKGFEEYIAEISKPLCEQI